jgi:hypothetical protein
VGGPHMLDAFARAPQQCEGLTRASCCKPVNCQANGTRGVSSILGTLVKLDNINYTRVSNNLKHLQ